MKTDVAPVIRLQDYLPPDFLVDHVDLTFDLHPARTRVTSRLSLRRNPEGFDGTPLVLEGDELTLAALLVDGRAAPADSYTAAPDKLVLITPPAAPFVLTIETVLDPSANTKLMGLYRTNGVYCTQCEAEGFRRITYFPDRPDVMAVYRVRIEAERDEAPILLSNGNPTSVGLIEGGDRHFAVWDDPHPKPSYLFALVAGDLGFVSDTFETVSGRKVDLNVFVEKGKEARADYAMGAIKRSMAWDEQTFGREYDLDVFSVVAVSDFNMGAMENKGLNVFNDKYVLASPDTATDADYRNIEAIIGHEYFHNWSGNRVTCRDWFQLCLKEGLTVFRDQEFSSDMRSRAVERIQAVRTLRAAQFVEDAGPLAHPVRPEAYKEINNFYTATVYNKGAEVVRMIKTLIGPAAFRKGMDLYYARNDGRAATVEDFITCFAEVSGRDMGQFMRWYRQAGTPTLRVSQQYDAAKKSLRLDFEQTIPATPGQTEKQPAVIPVLLGLIGEGGAELAPNQVLVLETAKGTKTFEGIAERPVPSLLRGFSAPVNLIFDCPDNDLLTLARHDKDAFNRWEALQRYAVRLCKRAVETLGAGGRPEGDAGLAEALNEILRAGMTDPAFTAVTFAMPSEQDIAREIGDNVDPDAIGQACDLLHATNARACLATARALYADLSSPQPFSTDAASAGRRSLRAATLSLLAWGDRTEGAAAALAQFRNATTMTDRHSALAVLNMLGGAAREDAFAAFEADYGDEPLMLDQWFTLQGMDRSAGALDRVKGLLFHPGFSMANPNRVRALVGAFATGNPRQFHRADGAAYRFLAGFIRELDQINPQVAARMATAFRTYKSLEPGRRAHAEQALASLRGGGPLSRDVSDIVDRALT